MASIYQNGVLQQHINNASMQDINAIIQAGIDPKTGLPFKCGETASPLKGNILKLLRVRDQQDAVNRYTWYNLPSGLDGQLIERILYYRGQGMFFYMKENETFYFLPYTLDGDIDVYGRFTGVTPLPFNGSASSDDKGKEKPWIIGLKRKPIYSIKLDELKINDLYESCVLLSDYSKQISQTVLPRQSLNDPLLDVMSDLIPFERTALLNSTGIMGMRVNSTDEQSNVEAASRSINQAALDGRKYIAVTGSVDFQELTEGNVATGEEFMMAFQSLDNFRKSLYGLENGGVFQKNTYQTIGQTTMNVGECQSPYQDGLTLRQEFCDIVNSIWGLGIWCDTSEQAIGADKDMNGEMVDKQDQSGFPGEQPEGAMNE